MREWSWQKWVGKLVPLFAGIAGSVWTFIENEPQWYPVVLGFGTMIAQWVVATFPTEE